MTCSGCGRPFEAGQRQLTTQMASGRVTGTWHKNCYRRRRSEVSKKSH